MNCTAVGFPLVSLVSKLSKVSPAGLRELSPPALNFQRLYAAETNALEPILIVTSPSVDASQDLLDVAHIVRGSNKYYQVCTS